jgi:hypothetical protein
LGAELALRDHRVALIDRDQGQHLCRVFDFTRLLLPAWSSVRIRELRCASSILRQRSTPIALSATCARLIGRWFP